MLHDEPLIPGGRIPVHVLIVVVQAEQIAERFDPIRAVGEAIISAAFGSRGKYIRMLIVVASVNPAGKDEHRPVDPEIVPQVLGDLRRLVERVSHVDDLLRAPVVLGPRQQPSTDEGLEIRRAEDRLDIGVGLDLVTPGPQEAPLTSDSPIRASDLYVPAFAKRLDHERLRALRQNQRCGYHSVPWDERQIRPRALDFEDGIWIVPVDKQRGAVLDSAEHGHRVRAVVAVGRIPADTRQPLRRGE